MHDPLSVAFEIKSLIKDQKGYRKPLITIWHKDPETDHTDDSCGLFIRARHTDQKVLNQIRKEFDFNFEHNYWFDKEGIQKFSTTGILVQMYTKAAWIHFKHDRRKLNRFMRKYIYDIICFAENDIDCGGDSITNKYNCKNHAERFGGLASMVYTDILRKERKWWNHPKWHIHHWKIQFNFMGNKSKTNETNDQSNPVDHNLRETV